MEDQQGASGKELQRVNLMLKRDHSEWLDGLAHEIRANTGAKVSRSEIVRAALSTMSEIHRLAPKAARQLIPLGTCKTETELALAGVLAMRLAVMK